MQILIITTNNHRIELENDGNSSLKPSSNLELLVNQFNIANPENSSDPEKVRSSKYYDIAKMHDVQTPQKEKKKKKKKRKMTFPISYQCMLL